MHYSSLPECTHTAYTRESHYRSIHSHVGALSDGETLSDNAPAATSLALSC